MSAYNEDAYEHALIELFQNMGVSSDVSFTLRHSPHPTIADNSAFATDSLL